MTYPIFGGTFLALCPINIINLSQPIRIASMPTTVNDLKQVKQKRHLPAFAGCFDVHYFAVSQDPSIKQETIILGISQVIIEVSSLAECGWVVDMQGVKELQTPADLAAIIDFTPDREIGKMVSRPLLYST